jgi:hypothetical protein
MSMNHKAYVFSYDAFDTGLRPLLIDGLRTGDPAPIRQFIEANRDRLVDPYEAEPLHGDWEEQVDPKDVHTYGDFALTRYYNPLDDFGLDNEWRDLSDRLDAAGIGNELTLGHPVGLPDRELLEVVGGKAVVAGTWFDPGKLGSYFQPPTMVREHLNLTRETRSRLGDWVEPILVMLQLADTAGCGMYVTF